MKPYKYTRFNIGKSHNETREYVSLTQTNEELGQSEEMHKRNGLIRVEYSHPRGVAYRYERPYWFTANEELTK